MYIRMNINKETGNMLYMDIIGKDEEQILFAKLCNLMNNNNKIKYVNLKQLANKLGIKSTCRLSNKLVALEKLGIIIRELGYIGINVNYASKVIEEKQTKPVKDNTDRYIVTISKLDE